MSILIDTSAFLAIGDRQDQKHPAASRAWLELIDSDEELLAPSYTIVETTALLQRRGASAGVRSFAETILPALSILWVDAALHETAMAAFLTAGGGRHAPSLVDCITLEILRRGRAENLFAYDSHFEDRGLTLIGQ